MRASLALAVVAALLLSEGGSAVAVEVARSAEAPAAQVPALAPALPALSVPGAAADRALTAAGPSDLAVSGPQAELGAPEAAAVRAEGSLAASRTPASAVPAAEAAGLAAEGRGRGGWSSALRRFFDRSSASPSDDDGLPPPSSLGSLSPEQIPVLLVAPGRAPERSTLAQAPALLAARGLSSAFVAEGHVRLVLGEGAEGPGRLSEDQLDGLSRLLKSYGVETDSSRRRVERVLLQPAAGPDAPAHSESSPARRLLRVAAGAAAGAAAYAAFGAEYPLAAALVAAFAAFADRLAVESVYAARAFAAALRDSRRPTWREVGGGFVGKIAPGMINAAALWYAYNKAAPHPLGAAVAIALSMAVEIFHGVWADTWNNLQSKLGAYRGLPYQGLFNFFYGQTIGVSYRLVAWITLANVAAPWTGAYWAPMIVMSVIGTFISTLGFRGLNGLYQKGAITRWGRSKRQYLRDIFLMITGPLFGTGYLALTFLSFAIQQSFDLYFYFQDKRTATKPILYVVDPAVAASPEFEQAFVKPIDPLRQAAATLADNEFAKPFVAAYRWLKAKLSAPK